MIPYCCCRISNNSTFPPLYVLTISVVLEEDPFYTGVHPLISCSNLTYAVKDDLTRVGDNVLSVRNNLAKLQLDHTCNSNQKLLSPTIDKMLIDSSARGSGDPSLAFSSQFLE